MTVNKISVVICSISCRRRKLYGWRRIFVVTEKRSILISSMLIDERVKIIFNAFITYQLPPPPPPNPPPDEPPENPPDLDGVDAIAVERDCEKLLTSDAKTAGAKA